MGLSSGERIPNQVSILRFRHLLEEQQLAEQILAAVNATLANKGLMQGGHGGGRYLDCRAQFHQKQRR